VFIHTSRCVSGFLILWTMVRVAQTLAQPIYVESVWVEAGGEVGGPEYDYRIGTFEIRNDEFVAFLNDAMANPDNERGQYVYVDLDTGNVYVNSARMGALGNGSVGRTILMFSPVAAGQIEFVNGSFAIVAGGVSYAAHPVTGVSWYGALKFCNWLTIQVGIDPDQRCYTEAADDNPNRWHPITTTDTAWALRGLNDSERAALTTQYLGYRLPMDEGKAVSSPYNEWYKAAAYDPAAPDVVRTRPFGPNVAADHWIFGFGRDSLEDVDANVLNSGDPFEADSPATSPTGYFDGVNLLADLTATRNTGNRYGLYDMSGNVWEWMQDQGGTTALRRYRGGGWDLTAAFAESTFTTSDLPHATPNWVGFRVVQADLGLDPEVSPGGTGVTRFIGPAGGPFSPLQHAFTIRSMTADAVQWAVASDVAWLELDGFSTTFGTLDPFARVSVSVALNEGADVLPVGTHVATLTFSADGISIATRTVELEATGPFVDVTPASGLVSSGPAGGPFFPDAKTYTLTNNTEQQLPWQATSDVAWLLINGGTSAIGSLAPGLDTEVTITLNTPQLVTLPINTVHSAVVLFEDVASGASATRTVVVGVGLSPLTLEMTIVPGDDPQPDGPTHGFRIGTNEVTNREFLAFLNDTYVSPALPRGYWMYHDTDSGDVYLNGQPESTIGTDGAGTLLFDSSINSRIEYDGIQYRVLDDSEAEPVTGVTWYGAVKFCNWLTLLQGVDASQLAYTQGPLPEDWHPVTVSTTDWLVRDLTEAERMDLVNNYAGFRLPMDGGVVSAAPYNEWYKAAAWTHETGGTDLLGTTMGAASDGVSSCDLVSDPADRWWSYTPIEDGNLRLELTFDPTNIHLFSVHTGCPATACNDIGCHLDGPTQVHVEAGETYWIRVAARGDSVGPFTLTIDGPGCTDGIGEDADNCLDAEAVCPGELGVNRLYGFGRDVLESEDANYWDSGDTENNKVTPVGWFDGLHLLADGATRTRDTQNGYGLRDICGNVSEWLQDHGDDPSTRATRGGSWQTIASSGQLDNLTRSADIPGAARTFAGFRVVKSQANGEIVVTPDEDVAGSGPVGGPYAVDAGGLVFTMQVPGARLTSEYEVSTAENWLELNGEGQSIRGVIEPPFPGQPDLTVDVLLALNDEAHALRAPAEPALEMASVPAGHAQPLGPAYSFRIAKHETTNEGYTAFLNNALVNLTNARGAYLYFDTDLGDVFINDTEAGETGSGSAGRTIRVFNTVVNPRISFDTESETYAVEPGFEQHPVTGASWYGAVKYCNWLTLHDGVGLLQRAYTEGPNPGDWRPVTISSCDWWGTDDTDIHLSPQPGARDLNEDERADLINNYRGYRLPMDDGLATANTYNEWYKAAAWDNVAAIELQFGFGRDGAAAQGDANFQTSGDPFESGTTPVGFYDGTRYNEGGGGPTGDGTDFQTIADQNPYGLFDMSGNVEEWTQDRGDSLTERSTRGGSWLDDPASGALDTAARRSVVATESFSTLGFRVVQAALDHRATILFDDVTSGATTTRKLRLLLREPMHIDMPDGLDAAGPFGGPFVDDRIVYTLTSESETAADWQATVTQSGTRWLDVNGGVSDTGQITNTMEAVVDVRTNAASMTLPPGEYAATLRLENLTTGYFETRHFTLTIDEPLQVAPDGWQISTVWGVPVDPALTAAFDLTNDSSTDVDYAATAAATWITLNEGEPANGTLEPFDLNGQVARVAVATTDDIDDLPIGTHEATIAFRNTTAGSNVNRTVTLEVQDPLKITPKAFEEGNPDFEWRGPVAGPFTLVTPPAMLEAIGNLTVFYEMSIEAGAWLDFGGTTTLSGHLLPGGAAPLLLALTPAADTLGAGQHTLEVTFTDITTAHVQTRTAVLVVEGDLSVTPAIDIETSGREGGPIRDAPQTYTIRNLGADAVTWSVNTSPPASWIRIAGGASATGPLNVGASTDLLVGIDTAAAAGLPAGIHQVDVLFSTGVGQPVVRRVKLVIVQANVTVAESVVPLSATQPGGPTYDYRMARTPTTNAEFAEFLNDARANAANERGQYLYFDLDSGDVYINNAMAGAEGTAAPSATRDTLIFDASMGRITFANNTFATQAGFENHPVVGVSWYGAVKYANWLTLDHGMGDTSRCYAEAASADLNGWHPVTIATADWSTRPLNDTERGELASDCFGFRLPMDHQQAQASPYNEWYKAAAWDPLANGGVGTNHTYGFGRDAISNADANFRCSGDPSEDAADCMIGGTTPAGFFNGVSTLTDGTPTSDTSNGFGIYDTTGNVFQWLQGRFNGTASILGNRTLRGGSWDSPIDSPLLRANGRTHAPAGQTHELIGFRVMRTLPAAGGDINQDGVVDQVDFAQMVALLDGPGIGVLPGAAVFDFNADGDIDLADFATFQTTIDSTGT